MLSKKNSMVTMVTDEFLENRIILQKSVATIGFIWFFWFQKCILLYIFEQVFLVLRCIRSHISFFRLRLTPTLRWEKGLWPLDDLWIQGSWDHMFDSTQGSLCSSPMKYIKVCGYCDLFAKTWTKGHWPLDDLWPHICWGHMCDSIQVTCVTLSKDHYVQVPWEYINVCGYSDQFCKLPHTFYALHNYVLHTSTYYIQNEWSLSLFLNSVQTRQKNWWCLTGSYKVDEQRKPEIGFEVKRLRVVWKSFVIDQASSIIGLQNQQILHVKRIRSNILQKSKKCFY